MNVEKDDFRFCAWEVRLTGRIAAVNQIDMWGCDQQSYQAIRELAMKPDHALAPLAEIKPVVIDDLIMLRRELEERIQ